jgi:hypothetical protein
MSQQRPGRIPSVDEKMYHAITSVFTNPLGVIGVGPMIALDQGRRRRFVYTGKSKFRGAFRQL